MTMMMTMMTMMMMIIVVSRAAKFKRIVQRLDAKELPAHRELGLPRGTSRAIEDDDGHSHGLAIQYNLNAGAYSASNWEVHGSAEASNRLRVCVSVLFCMFRPLRFV